MQGVEVKWIVLIGRHWLYMAQQVAGERALNVSGAGWTSGFDSPADRQSYKGQRATDDVSTVWYRLQ